MKQHPDHTQNIVALRRIEGQVRGIQKMIERREYCVDIITQLHSVIGAICRVEDEIFKKHIDGCVTDALKGKSHTEKQKKVDEIVGLIAKFRKSA